MKSTSNKRKSRVRPKFFAHLPILLFAMITLQLSAQKTSNEFQIYGGAGIPVLSPKGSTIRGFSGDAGLGFTTFIDRQIGLHFGVGFGLNNVEINVDDLITVTPGLIDANALLFDLHTTLSGYKEVQKSTFFTVPIMLQFQPNTHGFYAMGGVKLLFQYRTAYESRVEAFHNAANYLQFDNSANTQTFAGLGPFPGNNTTGNFDLGLFTMLTLEMGMKWQISENTFLYTGAFFDYGLSDPVQSQRRPLGDYYWPEHLQHLTLMSFADRINPATVGIKLRLAFTRSSTPRMRQPSRSRRGMMPGYCPHHVDRSRNQRPVFNMP
jgi:hypothetical protein